MIKLQCGRAYKMAKVLKYMPSKKIRIKKRAYKMAKVLKYMPSKKIRIKNGHIKWQKWQNICP